jgi:aryl-alcohol dehydrogenase-like predicted oxidoreductase
LPQFPPPTKILFFSLSRGEERGLSRKHIIESVQASLKRLQLDYIDIVIIHKADAMCPMEGKALVFVRFMRFSP